MLPPPFVPVPRAAWESRDAFYRDYVRLERPVVFTGASASWPCTAAWTPEYLARVGRGVEIEVATGACEETVSGNLQRQKLRTTLDTFVTSVHARRAAADDRGNGCGGGRVASVGGGESPRAVVRDTSFSSSSALSSSSAPSQRRRGRGRKRARSSGRRTTTPPTSALSPA